MALHDCIEWQGAKNKDGYGITAAGGVTRTTHRRAWEVYHQVKLKTSEWLLHSCDNPACFNIAHLRIGTAKENSRDCVTRGRRPCGEEHTNAVYSEVQIRRLVALRNAGVRKALAARVVGVPEYFAKQIYGGHVWKHLSRPLPAINWKRGSPSNKKVSRNRD